MVLTWIGVLVCTQSTQYNEQAPMHQTATAAQQYPSLLPRPLVSRLLRCDAVLLSRVVPYQLCVGCSCLLDQCAHGGREEHESHRLQDTNRAQHTHCLCLSCMAARSATLPRTVFSAMTEPCSTGPQALLQPQASLSCV